MQLAAVIEKPRYDLTLFKVHFGLLTLKGYTKGEHVLRFEAITHNTRQLGCGRLLTKFPDIVARLTGMLERFTTALDCVDIGFIPDRLLTVSRNPPRSDPERTAGAPTSTAHACGPHWPRSSRWRRRRVGITVADLTGESTRWTPTAVTPPAKPPTICASSVAKTSSNDKVSHTDITRLPKPRGRSRHCSPCGNTSSHPSSPVSAAPNSAGNQRSGHPSTATTRPCASTCKTSSHTSASTASTPPLHRQHFVDNLIPGEQAG